MTESPLVFLKLGGSLLGDKRRLASFRAAAVARLGREIVRALKRRPGMRLLLAHGGGGLAHFPAAKYRTREGLFPGGGGWRGFAETRRGVLEMNRRVLDALASGGLRPVLVSPCAGLLARDGRARHWDLHVIRALLAAGQTPLIHGDAVLDERRGFTILSTEELFLFLAVRLHPKRVVLACDVEGVYSEKGRRFVGAPLVSTVDRTNIAEIRRALSSEGNGPRAGEKPQAGKAGRLWHSRPRLCGVSPQARAPVPPDVTGGMAAKVDCLYELVRKVPGLEARIVSGLSAGTVQSALLGGEVGTAITGRRKTTTLTG